MIKVLMADDQVILRESLKFIIEQDDGIEVVGCASNGQEALQMCKSYTPDIVLMDIMMPVCDGVEGTKLIKSQYPSIKIIILTTFSDDENIKKALQNGASGYILKDVKPDELVLAVKSVAKGFNIIHHDAFDTVMKKINTETNVINNSGMKSNFGLTEREMSVVSLIVDGKSNKEISECLYITEGSVKNVITTVLEKLQLKDRTQLAVFAVKNNLV